MAIPKVYYLFVYRGREQVIWSEIWAYNDREAADKTIEWINWWKREFAEEVFGDISVETWADDWPHWHTKRPVWTMTIQKPKRRIKGKIWYLDICGGPDVRTHIWAKNEGEAIKKAMEWTRRWRKEFRPVGEVKGKLWEEPYPHDNLPVWDWWVNTTPILVNEK